MGTIKQPEYRQMIVECLVLFTSIVLTTNISWLNTNIFNMDQILQTSEEIFINENLTLGADDRFLKKYDEKLALQFLDSAPSGQFGTLTYISRAIAEVLSV